MAERIARTEAARAWADGFAEKYMDDDSVVAFQWKLASRHPKFDICDLYAEANLYGLGKGIYPKNATPRLPVHPHCLCHLAPVYRSELKGKKAVDQLEEDGRAWLEKQPLYHRQQILGIAGCKSYERGADWRTIARNYSPRVMQSRTKHDIIKASGALNPFSNRATEHAVRYYEEIRHRKTDAIRIAQNTGFRAQDIQAIKDYIFVEEHDLVDGHRRFYEDYEMAQSWQRLIEGRNIQERDIVLLNHEFLERELVLFGYFQQEAHEKAESIYNYAILLRE